jgi:hypothetical protein
MIKLFPYNKLFWFDSKEDFDTYRRERDDDFYSKFDGKGLYTLDWYNSRCDGHVLILEKISKTDLVDMMEQLQDVENAIDRELG